MIARFFAWLRLHQRPVDFILMLPFALAAVLARARYVTLAPDGIPREVALPAHYTLVVVMCLPLVWRRRWPRAVFAFITLVAVVQWLAGINIAACDLTLMVAMYTIAAQCAFRWALAALVVVECGMVAAVWRLVAQPVPQDSWRALISYGVTIGAIWLSGLYISTRRKYTLSLEERAERLERERDAQAEVATAAERARIARELHDVIAHSISVMVVQADGAAYTVDSDAARARRAMEAIGGTGRQALMEMRRMLGVLRESDGAATLAPQPGVEQLTDLVEQIRAAGLPVELEVDGDRLSLPVGQELAIYRIVQEALTNVMKHAGPVATARVALHYGARAIEVRIRDDGRGATFTDGRGHGLVGMRERAAVYGGDVSAEPAPGGGFEVVARLPVKEGVNAYVTGLIRSGQNGSGE
jgi:signal transduction histidine kinase